jgi:hypothetical protein
VSELALKISALVAWVWLGGLMLAGLLDVGVSGEGVAYFWGLLLALGGLAQAALYRHDPL